MESWELFTDIVNVMEIFYHRAVTLFLFRMGWTYNTANPDAPTNAPTIVAVGVCFTTLSLIVVCFRVYVRRFMIHAFAVGRQSSRSLSEMVTDEM